MFKVLLFIVIGLSIGINLFAFVFEKIMKKRINRIAKERENSN